MTRPFAVDLGWAAVLDRLDLTAADLLRAAELPADLFTRERPRLEAPAFLRLWHALERLLDDPAPGLAVGRAIETDAFSPPLFAAFSSPNLIVALERLALFKPLLGPLRLEVAEGPAGLDVTYSPEGALPLPAEFLASELVFLVSLARMATRSEIRPLQVEMIAPPATPGYRDFFGTAPRHGPANRLRFSQSDARRPFLSVNAALYAVFEPELRLRLEEAGAARSLTDRLHAALMEALPSGRTRIADVAPRLGLSPRSLQRKLGQTGTSFAAELADLRSRLAADYLRNTAHSSAEISYLLGYSDPNSFIRAFHDWTGTTPEALRRAARQ
ncbi:AraC family transcriptional regulator [Tropicimonas sp. IMCC6043]|uniref:AraC family transcriptional regulator n=1 Tax=Tropicimonas sp. IMCC6043 TaxID=2510645 RepID=UPI00101D9525|nr:AraC family transcriptional regulator [Tropicimonas sp. IMCC6043]RYH11230.1 AraC family transcriptional regulator [Tropicimonas sp. IMCC6043]